MSKMAMDVRPLVRWTYFQWSVCLCLFSGILMVLLHVVVVVKRAKQVRRCAQVLLDCRWFVKRFTEQRVEMLKDRHNEEDHVRVVSTLAAHLRLQVCGLEYRLTVSRA